MRAAEQARAAAPRDAETTTETPTDLSSETIAGAAARTPNRLERVRDTADSALARLVNALEEGKSDSLRDYLSVMAKFHRYSLGNVLLIFSQKPEATLVAGFRRWNDLERHVMKGEKGIAIMAPIVRKGRREGAPEAQDSQGEERTVRGFRVVYVFDVSQTEGQPLPEPETVRGDPGPFLERLTRHIEERGITLTRANLAPGVSGLSKGGRIELADGLTPAQEFSVLVHELAHEILHHDPEGERPASKTVRETEAEAVAFVVASSSGLDVGSSSSDYIQLYSGDRETLTASLARIQRVASEILSAIEPSAAQEAPALR